MIAQPLKQRRTAVRLLALALGLPLLVLVGCGQRAKVAQPPQPTKPAMEGRYDAVVDGYLVGWAWDPNQPDRPIDVALYDDQTWVATVKADEFRQDLLNKHMGDGKHGFRLAIPDSLKDGKTRTVRIKTSGTHVQLKGSPFRLTVRMKPRDTGPLAGRYEKTDGASLYGWAWDANQPDRPIDVALYEGTALVATVKADQFRQDLLDKHMGDGKHGFRLAIPDRLKDGKTRTLRIKTSGTDIDLERSPFRLTVRTKTAEKKPQ